MLILIFINIVIIILIYLKYYYNLPRSENMTEEEKEKIEKMDPIIIGCINDRGFNNNFDLIISEIINLNIKGYIKIKYDRNDINAYNYTITQNFDMEVDNINKYELVTLNFLFSDKMEVSKNELEEKLINTFNSYHVQYNELQKVLEKEFIKQHIIDECKEKELKQVSKIYKKISILLVIILFVLKIFAIFPISLFEILIYTLEILISNILILKASNYTDKGEILRNKIIKYQTEIEKQEFLVDKETMNEIILEKKFANSIALHINTLAKKMFIDDKVLKNATKSTKKVLIQLFIVFVVAVVIGLILQAVTKALTKDGIIWLYIMLTLMIAFAADITKFIGTIKKKK